MDDNPYEPPQVVSPAEPRPRKPFRWPRVWLLMALATAVLAWNFWRTGPRWAAMMYLVMSAISFVFFSLQLFSQHGKRPSAGVVILFALGVLGTISMAAMAMWVLIKLVSIDVRPPSGL
jgi:hypothetical protein